MEAKKITVFGGSQPLPDTPAYNDARRLGELIGAAGWTVLTGGYIGVMEAVSRGTAEAGGHVIGVTCDEIESWRSIGPNRWVREEMRYETTRERLFSLVETCDAAVAMPGGIGTLAEIAFMWSQLQTEALSSRPLVLIGQGWKATFESFLYQFEGYIPAAHIPLISLAPDVEAGFGLLSRHFSGEAG